MPGAEITVTRRPHPSGTRRRSPMTGPFPSPTELSAAEALRLLRPGLVLVENVAVLRTRGLATVSGDLAALGYDTAWMCLRAADVGAPHRRDRMFIAAAPRKPTNHATGPAPSAAG